MAETSENMEQSGSRRARSRSSFASDALKLTGGTIFAQVLSILVSPILSRLFAPEAFGTTAIFFSVVTVISVVVCLRYEQAIMLPSEDEEAGGLLIGSLFFVGLFTLLTALASFFLGEQISTWLNAPELQPLLWMLPIAVLTNGVFLALRYWSSRTRRFGLLASLKVTSAAGQTAIRLGTGFLGLTGPGSLISAAVIGYIIPAAGLGYTTLRKDRAVFHANWGQVKEQLVRYRKFPLITTWSGLLNTLSVQIPVMMLSASFSQATVGYYSFGLRMIGLPMSLVGEAISQVFFQRASEARNQGKLPIVVQNTLARLTNLGLYPLLALGLVGPELFSVVFGPEWTEAGVYAQILCLWQLAVFVGSPISTLASVVERQEVGLAFNVVLLISRVISLAVGGALGGPRLALLLYAGSGTAIWLWLILWLVRASGASARRAIASAAQPLLYAAPGLLLAALAKWSPAPDLIIVMPAGAGAIFYYAMLIRQDRSLLDLLTSALSRRLPRNS